MSSSSILPSNFLKHSSKNPLQRKLINNFYNCLVKLIKNLSVSSILDTGCGEGFTLNQLEKQFPNKTYLGIDSSLKVVNLGNKLFPKIKLKVGNIYRLPFKNQSFDLVICSEVLEHLANPKKALEEISRVSKKYCLLSVPNEPWFIMVNFLRGKYLSTWGNHPEHINHWGGKTFQNFLKANNFKLLKIKQPFPWILVLARTIFKAD